MIIGLKPGSVTTLRSTTEFSDGLDTFEDLYKIFQGRLSVLETSRLTLLMTFSSDL